MNFSTVSSPLTPRSINLQSSPACKTPWSGVKNIYSMPPSPPDTPSRSVNRTINPIFTRASLQSTYQPARPRRDDANPLNRTSQQRANQRRTQYLEDNRDRRDESRWAIRGDQILRRDFLNEQRLWTDHIALTAPQTGNQDEEEEDEDDMLPWNRHGPSKIVAPAQEPLRPFGEMQDQIRNPVTQDEMDMVEDNKPIQSAYDEEAELEDLIRAEQADLEAYVAMHEAQEAARRAQGSNVNMSSTQSTYGSDDDDYDELMAALAEDTEFEMDIS